jgi:hypothetical protein
MNRNLVKMWILHNDTKTVDKICNQCGLLIETLDQRHPTSIFMYEQLGLNEWSDTTTLKFGLEPFHWHPISNTYPNCLVPTVVHKPLLDLKEKHEKELDEITHKNTTGKQELFKLPTKKHHAPYEKAGKIKRYTRPGRPSTSKLKAELQALSDKLDEEIDKVNYQP